MRFSKKNMKLLPGLLIQGGGNRYLSHVEVFALMAGALAHDMGHKGLNNGYYQKTPDSQIAKQYFLLEVSLLEGVGVSFISFFLLQN